jgi:phage regulator Rha-like protein
MKKNRNEIIIAEEIIISKIYNIRGKQVMLASDLSELYQVEAKVLNQQVKRNIGKFPDRYMFQLTKDEYARLRSQNVTLKRGQHSKYLPYAFTEHGVLMLSSVLNSERARKVNILIIDTFIRLREILFLHKDTANQLEKVMSKLDEHDNQISVIFEYLKQLEQSKQVETDFKNRKRIGFNPAK